MAAIAADADALDNRFDPVTLANQQLWAGGPPTWVMANWEDLKSVLVAARENWEVWINWYEDRLFGRVANQTIEIERASTPNDAWEQGPAFANARIARESPSKLGGEASLNLSKRLDLHKWLSTKSNDWAVVIAARSALRAIPLVAPSSTMTGNRRRLILNSFRAAATAWVAAAYPSSRHIDDAAARAAAKTASDIARLPSLEEGAAVRAVAAAANAVNANAAEHASYATEYAASSVGERPFNSIFWAQTAEDAQMLEHGLRARDVAEYPLWFKGTPNWLADIWQDFSRALRRANEGWEVWTGWYDKRLAGGPSDRDFEIAVVSIADKIWDDSINVINRHIAKLAQETPPSWDFFVSYSSDDEAFARWISDVLTSAGFSVFAQFNDMPAGSNFVHEMQRGLGQSGRLIALLSQSYIKSDHCQAEWSAAFNSDPSGEKRKLIPLIVSPVELPPLARQIISKSLIGLSPLDAGMAVLQAIGHQDSVLFLPSVWPGSGLIDEMQRAVGGIFQVAPGADLRLEHIPSIAAEVDEGFAPNKLFANDQTIIVDFLNYTRRDTGNFRCSDRLRARATALHEEASVDFSVCDPLALNRHLVWVLRMIALDKADGLIPKNDEFDHHASDLYGIYNRLEHIFSNLKQFRKMNARHRFEPPSVETEHAIYTVYDSFGNPEISEGALSSSLSRELKQAGDDIEGAKKVANAVGAEQSSEITVVSHADAATRSLAVWSWLSNAREKFVKSGKTADEVASAIERYEKVYNQISPHMVRYMEYLLRWFF